MQWKWKAIDPPGQSKTDQEIIARIFLAVRDLYRKEGGALPEQVLNIDWTYTNPAAPDLSEFLKEINGKALVDIPDPKDKTKTIRTAGQQIDSFGQLQDDGSTMCGNWLHVGVLTEAGNMAQRRNPVDDPTGLGMYHNWGFSWPANRRVMYNRASADAEGKAWDPTASRNRVERREVGRGRPGHEARRASGQVRSVHHAARGGRTAFRAIERRPLPGALRGGRVCRRQSAASEGDSNPATKTFTSDKDVYGKRDQFPIVSTTYRLTENYHYWTKHTDRLNQLQPGFFVEIPEGLAKEKGITNGGEVRVTSARGSIEGVAMVTKRLRPLQVDGKQHW